MTPFRGYVGRASRRRQGERGVALILAILTLFILTVFGIGLLFTTTTELQIAGAEATVNKTFYAADSGVQYGIQQGKLNFQSGPCATPVTGSWCFTVPERNTGTAPRTLSVNVTPFRIVDFQLAPGNQLNVGTTPLFDVGYHFDSFSADTALNSQKQIAVDIVVGPVPFVLPNK